MIYLYITAAIFAVYYFRRYWLTPWATFVSLSETKSAGVFLTVHHVAWYPPFLGYDATYHLGKFDGRRASQFWVNVKSGSVPMGCGTHGDHEWHQRALSGILQAARARNAETEELLK